MTERVYPSSKPVITTVPTAAATAPNNRIPTKPNLYNPNRLPYRSRPYQNRRRRRNFCCCCCFWSILLLLIFAFLATIAGSAVYLLYRPQPPAFTVSSLRISTLNLTTASDGSSFHLTTILNLTITSKNPNEHIDFFYDPFTIVVSSNDLQLGNGTFPELNSYKKQITTLRSTVSDSENVDPGSVNSLSSDLKKKSGFPLSIQIDTKVRVKMGNLASKKVGIRVNCAGVKGFAPKGKSPSLATIDHRSKCKVDLRIKIWNLTF